MLIQLFSRSSNPYSPLSTTKRIALASALFLIMTVIASRLALSQPYERSEVSDTTISFNTLKLDDAKMHYAYSGDLRKPGVLFVHGTPGGWNAFERYLENKDLQRDFFMVSVDRLGWGKSPFDKQKVSGNFEQQASGITSVLQQYPDKKWTIVGHSLGASLAPQIALQSPESVNSLILLAGSLNPKLGFPRWYNYAASTWLVSKIVGQMMTNSNREIMSLRKQLVEMSVRIDQTKLDTKLTVIQGMKDKLVSPKNPTYVTTHWKDNFTEVTIIELPEEGHFLPWRQTPLIIDTIRALNIPSI